MKSDLFNELETKIGAMLDEVELLRMEISELRAAKQQLESEQEQTDVRIQQLLEKFKVLDEVEG